MVLAALLIGCDSTDFATDPGVQGEDSGFDDGVDTTPPSIEFEPIVENQPSGQDVVITATITDEGTGVFIATLKFRNETASSKDWQDIGFIPDAERTVWTATIAAEEQRSGGMWYYLLAVDGSQNETTDPERGADDPYHFGYSD